MLRASSEMAVAIRARSPATNPSLAPRSRPCCRATTMSVSVSMITMRCPSSEEGCTGDRRARSLDANCGSMRSVTLAAVLIDRFRRPVEKSKALLEIESGANPFQRQAQLNHGERHLRLDSHDHG